MRSITHNKLAGKLSVLLVIAMLMPVCVPVHAAETVTGNPIVISNLPDDCKISIGIGEGAEVGTKGTISRDGKDIARFEITRVEWGYSRISVSDIAKGESVRVGDRVNVTNVPAPGKKGKGGAGKALVILLAIGAIAALAGGGGGGGGSSASHSSSIAVTTQKASMPADGVSNTTITAAITDASHVAVPDGTAVTFSTTAGTIIPAQTTTTGGNATATLTAGSSTGAATVTATSGGKSSTVRVTLVTPTSGGSASIDLAAGPTTIQVVGSGGAQTQSTITATCRDAQGNLATGGTVTFTSSIGNVVGTAAINASGIATTTFTSNATGAAEISASWSGAEASTTVNVTPGPPHTIAVQCNPSAIQCDGNSFASVTATVRDIAGNLVTDGTLVNFAVQADINGGGNGSITPQAQTTNGVANALIFSKTGAGATSNPGTATVVARVVRANQPAGIPVASSDLDNHVTQVQFISLDVAEIHMGALPNNIRGLDWVNRTSTITAVVYDTHHNPVPDGTAVYFTANQGMIYGNGGTAGNVTMSTTTLGKAEATLVSDAPGLAFNGLVNVTATCGSVTLTESGLVIFSGWPSPGNCSAIVDPMPTTIASVGGQATITVIAHDINDNPIVDGSKVTATTSKGNIVAANSGTVGGTIMYTLTTSTNATAPTEPGVGKVTISIDSSGQNPETGGAPVVIEVPFTVAP